MRFSRPLKRLDHNVHWCEENNEIFHATWDNMPTWCRYCHQTGHTKFDCEKSKARIVCYGCHQFGHRSFECPRKQPLTLSKKNKERKDYPPSQRGTLIHLGRNLNSDWKSPATKAGLKETVAILRIQIINPLTMTTTKWKSRARKRRTAKGKKSTPWK